MFRSRQRIGPTKVVVFALLGCVVGGVLGVFFMSAANAVLQLRMVARDEENFSGINQARRAGSRATELQAGQAALQLPPNFGDAIHTLVTSNGSPYLNFQLRIMYGTYKAVQGMPGGERLVGFTRILHRTKPDVLMTEVPTYRVQPLTPKCDEWCEFPVSDRPNAVHQFFQAASQDPSLIKAPWLLLIETDYVWMKPLDAPRAEDAVALPVAFPFGYIVPGAAHLGHIMRRMYPASKGPISDIPGTGPAPVMMRLEEWLKVVPEWERLTAHIEADEESKKALGWVREMYAFSVAVALVGLKLDLRLPPQNVLIAQPPADKSLGSAAMFHYTWGTVFKDKAGAKVWEFDKRTYTAKELETMTPSIPIPPPFQDSWVQQDGLAVTQGLYDTMSSMLTQMNKVIATLPVLTAL